MRHGTDVKPNRGKKATLASSQTQFDPDEAVENALILSPDLPSIELADKLSREADAEFLRGLAREFFLKLVKAQRRKMQASTREQFRLPGFEHLPIRIQIAGDKKQKLLNANYYGTREYYKHLSAKYDARKATDPKVQEAKALMEFMREKSQTDRGITVGRAFGLT